MRSPTRRREPPRASSWLGWRRRDQDQEAEVTVGLRAISYAVPSHGFGDAVAVGEGTELAHDGECLRERVELRFGRVASAWTSADGKRPIVMTIQLESERAYRGHARAVDLGRVGRTDDL